MDNPLAHFDNVYPDLVTVEKSSGDASDGGTRSPDEAGALTDFDANSSCGSSLASTPPGRATNASTTATGTKRKRKKHYKPGYNSNKARDERKEALLLLRKQVDELQTLRDKLQRASSCSNSRADRRAIGTASVQQQAFGLPATKSRRQARAAEAGFVWKDVAATQYKERQRAEMENIRLKGVLECQLRMSKSLEKVLNRRFNERVFGPIRDEQKPRCINRPTDPDADASIFSELLAGIENASVEVDQDFEANGLARMVWPHHDAQVRRDGDDIVVNIYATKMMPFDFASAGQVTWDHYSHSMDRLPSRVVYDKQRKNFGTMDDTIIESFGLELESSRKVKANTHVWRVLRKFVGPDRVVIAWRAHCDPVNISTERMDGIHVLEKGYTVIEKAHSGIGTDSLVQTCYIIRPGISSGTTADQKYKVTAITDFLLDSVTHTISASHQMIENVLMDQALRGSGSSG